MERLVIIPGERESQAGRELQVRATQIAKQVIAQNLASVIGEEALKIGKEGQQANSDSELILWGRGERLTAAWTSLSPSDEVIPNATWDPTAGVVAEVLASERAASLEEPNLQASQFTNLGERRGRRISAMRALPVTLFGQPVGVLCRVAYTEEEVIRGATNNEVAVLALTFTRLAELKTLKMCLGLEV